jgi:hypothetical protein
VWTRQYGSLGVDVPRRGALGSDGNVVIVGNTSGTLPVQTSAGDTDVFVRKYDLDPPTPTPAPLPDALWAWGSNEYGQLGDGTTVQKTTPTPPLN